MPLAILGAASFTEADAWETLAARIPLKEGMAVRDAVCALAVREEDITAEPVIEAILTATFGV